MSAETGMTHVPYVPHHKENRNMEAWTKEEIGFKDCTKVAAQMPVAVSAGCSTNVDVPALYADRLMARLKTGKIKTPVSVSPADASCPRTSANATCARTSVTIATPAPQHHYAGELEASLLMFACQDDSGEVGSEKLPRCCLCELVSFYGFK